MPFTLPPGLSLQFFVYEFTGVQARVKVRFTSEGSSSSLCSLASVQRSFVSVCVCVCVYTCHPHPSPTLTPPPLAPLHQCPVVELLNNPQHRGTFQSMRSKATIDAQVMCSLPAGSLVTHSLL